MSINMPQKKPNPLMGALPAIGSVVGGFFGPVGSAIGGAAGQVAAGTQQQQRAFSEAAPGFVGPPSSAMQRRAEADDPVASVNQANEAIKAAPPEVQEAFGPGLQQAGAAAAQPHRTHSPGAYGGGTGPTAMQRRFNSY